MKTPILENQLPPAQSYEVDVGIFLNKESGRYHIVLRHKDGREQISDQSFATLEECEDGIKLFAAENNAQYNRIQ